MQKNRYINDELIRKHFSLFRIWEHCWKNFKNWKNNVEKNKIQTNLINSALRDLKEEIEDMSAQEKEIKNPNEIVNTVKRFLNSHDKD